MQLNLEDFKADQHEQQDVQHLVNEGPCNIEVLAGRFIENGMAIACSKAQSCRHDGNRSGHSKLIGDAEGSSGQGQRCQQVDMRIPLSLEHPQSHPPGQCAQQTTTDCLPAET